MKRPAPVLALLHRVQKRNREQRQQIRDQAVYVASLERQVAVLSQRAMRWRRTALELAPRVGPRAMDVCLLQVQSEEIQDLPEVAG